MNANNFNVEMLMKMAHSPVANYVIPGLTSRLIGHPDRYGTHGTIRLFECERDHQENITPHSHRFDLQCWVLAGSVMNRLWKQVGDSYPNADLYELSELQYKAMGDYKTYPVEQKRYIYEDQTYVAGDCYSMKASEIHSIKFSRGAKVLLFEGKSYAKSFFIEPVVQDEVIRTFQVAPWMFKRSSNQHG